MDLASPAASQAAVYANGLNVFSAIIQILVDVKICVALQLNASVFFVYFCYIDTTVLF